MVDLENLVGILHCRRSGYLMHHISSHSQLLLTIAGGCLAESSVCLFVAVHVYLKLKNSMPESKHMDSCCVHLHFIFLLFIVNLMANCFVDPYVIL